MPIVRFTIGRVLCLMCLIQAALGLYLARERLIAHQQCTFGGWLREHGDRSNGLPPHRRLHARPAPARAGGIRNTAPLWRSQCRFRLRARGIGSGPLRASTTVVPEAEIVVVPSFRVGRGPEGGGVLGKMILSGGLSLPLWTGAHEDRAAATNRRKVGGVQSGTGPGRGKKTDILLFLTSQPG